MRILRISFWLPFLLFVVFFATAIGLQRGNIDHWRKLPYSYRDSLYLPSSQYVNTISIGYNQFTADFLWLRMIQSFAAGWSLPENAAQMKSYFEVITDLDPRFNEVYSFAIMAIGEEGRHTARYKKDAKGEMKKIDKMVFEIADKGILKDPGYYKTPFEGAFYAFWSLNNAPLAKYYVRMAKTDPNYPDYINRWEGYFDVQQGRYQAAFEKFLGDYIHVLAAKNKDLYFIQRTQLFRAVNDWFISEIKDRLKTWLKDHKGPYPTVEELDAAGAFKGVTLPDFKAVNDILTKIIDGEMDPNIDQATLNKFLQNAVHPWDHLPSAPYDFIPPTYPGFVIWKGQQLDQKNVVLSKAEMLFAVRETIAMVDNTAVTYKKKTGKLPTTLAAFAPELDKFPDPFGDPWIWNSATGRLSCKAYPNLMKMDLPAIN